MDEVRHRAEKGGPCQLGREEFGFHDKKNGVTMRSLRRGCCEDTVPGGTLDRMIMYLGYFCPFVLTELSQWYPS